MDVPFISSGALSRAHYALVRKIETATSIPAADQVLLTEIETIRERLARAGLTEKQTKEYLILLLYCSMNLSVGLTVNMDFALPHAVNLAEAGRTVQNKRTGYMYCAEMMPKDHELQLMLVNTLRKDLEHPSMSRICLALEVLIQSPSEDIIPAVQDRLYELLSHNSPHVRRRTLYTFQALSTCHRDILERVAEKINQRLRDQEPVVVTAALSVSLDLLEVCWSTIGRQVAWNARKTAGRYLAASRRPHRALSTGKDIGNLPDSGTNSTSMQAATTDHRSLFGTEEQCKRASDLLEAQSSTRKLWIDPIRHLLVSQDVNDVYLFLTCLDCIEPKLWAGTTSEVPAVLEGWEVERIMQSLHSPDSSIRLKTLRILSKVDVRIVETYYTQILQMDRTSATAEELVESARRLMEIIEVLHVKDGETYAHSLRDIISTLTSQSVAEKQEVLQNVVEEVLIKLREAPTDFRSAFLGVFFALLDNPEQPLGPTTTVIGAAVVCEYLDNSPIPPTHLLQALSTQLPSYNAAIQDACLLSMIRLIAACEDIPESAVAIARKVQEQSGRYIRRRCEQFLNLSHSRTIVQHIVSKSKSSSLPDFLMSLEAYEAEKMARAATSPSLSSISSPERPSSRASSQASHTPGKLRYAAYDAPKLTSSLRRTRTRSRSPYSDRSGSSRFINEVEDPMSRTITAGDLTLASGQIELQTVSQPRTLPSTPPQLARTVDDLASRVDLIALDSPFIADPPVTTTPTQADFDFKAMWDKLSKGNLRGWCESPMDAVVRKLQGDLKIAIYSADSSNPDTVALLRLKEGEDDSCMWHLRCDDLGLKDTIGVTLKDI
ncbi:hypothetical protein NM688_g3093 [Phlebia brevispora]|uniref:Uncharacterized protein n=1 Tax=Phlebia brevispora TaxID=194682 RepID=A0ACC1T6M6_9APHY|nr:hypothetical protein NM688_g3093 [Phlebia brevispora]